MKVVIFGAGQVGSTVAKAIARRTPMVFRRTDANFDSPDALADLIYSERPDVIVNAVAYTAVDRAEAEVSLAFQVNAVAPGALAAAAAKVGSWLIHYSTDYVFDGEKRLPYSEEDATNPLNAYGRSKRSGEAMVAAAGDRFLILRTSWLHAPGHANFVRTILTLARSKSTLRVVDDQIGTPTSAATIADTTASIIDAIESGMPLNPGIYHASAHGETSWWGFAKYIVETALAEGAELTLRPEDVMPVASIDYPQAAKRPRYSCLANTKLEAMGIAMPDWRPGALDSVRGILQASTS